MNRYRHYLDHLYYLAVVSNNLLVHHRYLRQLHRFECHHLPNPIRTLHDVGLGIRHEVILNQLLYLWHVVCGLVVRELWIISFVDELCKDNFYKLILSLMKGMWILIERNTKWNVGMHNRQKRQSCRYNLFKTYFSFAFNSFGGIGSPEHDCGWALCAGRPGPFFVCSFFRHLARRFWNHTWITKNKVKLNLNFLHHIELYN